VFNPQTPPPPPPPSACSAQCDEYVVILQVEDVSSHGITNMGEEKRDDEDDEVEPFKLR
jgi:hypothetical protein